VVKQKKHATDLAVARFFYTNGLAFNVINSESFKEMIRYLLQHGHGYLAPSALVLSTTLLAATVEQLKKDLKVCICCFCFCCVVVA
jgi:hypothetical protein